MNRLAHAAARTPSPNVRKLLGKLTSLRLQGRREAPSGLALAPFDNLLNAGFSVGQLVTGRPAIRGHSGAALRWGGGWFEEFRDGGPGWGFSKEDRAAIDVRVDLLLKLFSRESSLPCLCDEVMLALQDG